MDDFGKNFFAHAALADDEHGEVGRRDTDGRFERGIEQVRGTDDAESGFYGLEVGGHLSWHYNFVLGNFPS